MTNSQENVLSDLFNKVSRLMGSNNLSEQQIENVEDQILTLYFQIYPKKRDAFNFVSDNDLVSGYTHQFGMQVEGNTNQKNRITRYDFDPLLNYSDIVESTRAREEAEASTISNEAFRFFGMPISASGLRAKIK